MVSLCFSTALAQDDAAPKSQAGKENSNIMPTSKLRWLEKFEHQCDWLAGGSKTC